MHLNECIELGHACGLTTLGEAFDNVNYHCTNLFTYAEINSEMSDLICEIVANYDLPNISNNIDSILI